MDVERFCIKFFPRGDVKIEDEAIFIPIFHEWIRLKSLKGTLLDVADYRHVPDGPGVMLVTHEINYAMDHTDGQFGLYAQRKLGPEPTHKDRILSLVRATATFGALLERDPRIAGHFVLEGGTFHYMANDRLQLPNTDEAFMVIQADLEAAAADLFPGQSVAITRLANDPRSRLTAVLQVEGQVDINTLAA